MLVKIYTIFKLWLVFLVIIYMDLVPKNSNKIFFYYLLYLFFIFLYFVFVFINFIIATIFIFFFCKPQFFFKKFNQKD